MVLISTIWKVLFEITGHDAEKSTLDGKLISPAVLLWMSYRHPWTGSGRLCHGGETLTTIRETFRLPDTSWIPIRRWGRRFTRTTGTGRRRNPYCAGRYRQPFQVQRQRDAGLQGERVEGRTEFGFWIAGQGDRFTCTSGLKDWKNGRCCTAGLRPEGSGPRSRFSSMRSKKISRFYQCFRWE